MAIKRRAPAVSIGMPVFNDERYLRAAIKDILAQEFSDFELILSDNCSTDGSSEICREFASKDPRVVLFRQDATIPAIKNFEFVLSQAQAPLFMWAASDDRWDKEFIRALRDKIQEHPRASSSFCSFQFIDENGLGIGSPVCFDLSSRSATARLHQLILSRDHYRDGFFYGLHRTERLRRATFARWWWPNQEVAIGNAYPILVCLMAVGECVHAGNRALWFNRLHTVSRHQMPFRRAAEVMRTLNLAVEMGAAMYRATKSPGLVVRMLPSLFFVVLRSAYRGALDTLRHGANAIVTRCASTTGAALARLRKCLLDATSRNF